ALSKACELAPSDRQAAHALGYCLARAGAYDQSLACFRRVDGEARAHYNLGRMLLHMKQSEMGRQHLQVALQIEPELTEAKELLAGATRGASVYGPVVPVQFEQHRKRTRSPALLPGWTRGREERRRIRTTDGEPSSESSPSVVHSSQRLREEEVLFPSSGLMR